MSSRRGRKPRLGGRLARMGAQGLNRGRVAVEKFAQPPEDFDDVARDAFFLLVSDLGEVGSLARSDVFAIELAAWNWSQIVGLRKRIVESGSNGLSEKGFMTGEAQALAAAETRFSRWIGELGLSPAARISSAGKAQLSFAELLESPTRGPGDDGGNVTPFRQRSSRGSVAG